MSVRRKAPKSSLDPDALPERGDGTDDVTTTADELSVAHCAGLRHQSPKTSPGVLLFPTECRQNVHFLVQLLEVPAAIDVPTFVSQ